MLLLPRWHLYAGPVMMRSPGERIAVNSVRSFMTRVMGLICLRSAVMLGYLRDAQPIQIQPRKVTPIEVPVLTAAISDIALCILLETHEVICFAHDTWFKIKFSLQHFPTEIRPTYSPSVQARSRYRCAEKITCFEDTFAIIGDSGDVFCWNVPPLDGGMSHGVLAVEPQRIWTSSRQLKAAKVTPSSSITRAFSDLIVPFRRTWRWHRMEPQSSPPNQVMRGSDRRLRNRLVLPQMPSPSHFIEYPSLPGS